MRNVHTQEDLSDGQYRHSRRANVPYEYEPQTTGRQRFHDDFWQDPIVPRSTNQRQYAQQRRDQRDQRNQRNQRDEFMSFDQSAYQQDMRPARHARRIQSTSPSYSQSSYAQSDQEFERVRRGNSAQAKCALKTRKKLKTLVVGFLIADVVVAIALGVCAFVL